MKPRTENKQALKKKALNPTIRRLRTKLLIVIVVTIYCLLNIHHTLDIV